MADERTANSGAPRRPLELNELRRTDENARDKPSFDIPDRLNAYYHQDGRAYRSATRNDKIEFVDRGNRMHGYRPISTFTIRSMVEIAESRGWKEMALTGDKAFQSRAYVEAKDRGIEVKGYQPTDKDQELLRNRADRREARSNPKVQAFLNASDEKTMKAAARKFPELKEAFAALKVVDKIAESVPGGEKAQANFKGLMQDKIALALHRGEPLPEVKIKQEQEKSADRGGQER